MTRPLRAALVALLVAAALAGCTARPADRTPAAATATPPAVQSFRCPTVQEVAALTAVAFTSGTDQARTCTYAADGTAAPRVTVRRLTTGATLAGLRAAALDRGTATTDVPQLAFDAFTTTTATGCTAWFSAIDGVTTSVSAQRPGASPAGSSCALATAVATLIGSGAGTAPTVAVIAPSRLLGTTTADRSWPWRVAAGTDARIDPVHGSGYVPSTATSSFATLASGLPADSAAVVFVSGTAEAGVPTLTVLRAVTLALSAASTRAPRAELVVVGPVSDGTTSLEELLTLRDNLRAAATVAGARFIDPTDAATTPSGVVLDAVAASVSAELANALTAR